MTFEKWLVHENYLDYFGLTTSLENESSSEELDVLYDMWKQSEYYDGDITAMTFY